MGKLRFIIGLLIIAGGLWYIYGDNYEESGYQGVVEEMTADFQSIKNSSAMDELGNGVQSLFGTLTEKLDNVSEEQTEQKRVEKTELEEPTEQSFSVSNIELGTSKAGVEEKVGAAKRSSYNEYGVQWFAYHENYQNFFMVAYDDQDKVTALYTNQDLISSKLGIKHGSSKGTVDEQLGKSEESILKGNVNYQIQSNDEYETFKLDDSYVTIFYDKHEENTVTSIQIISSQLEQQKTDFFMEPNAQVLEGFEYQLFDLTNSARVNHDLQVLTWDEKVRITARDHSSDMAIQNYFDHINLNGESPFDRMTADDISYTMAGENIAAGQLSSIYAHEGLMNSLGHRENILQTGFKSLGVGVAFNDEARPYYTENFLTN